MAVLPIALSIHKYIGLDVDAKPTGVPIGSTLFAYDTGITYICYDGTNWAVYDSIEEYEVE